MSTNLKQLIDGVGTDLLPDIKRRIERAITSAYWSGVNDANFHQVQAPCDNLTMIGDLPKVGTYELGVIVNGVRHRQQVFHATRKGAQREFDKDVRRERRDWSQDSKVTGVYLKLQRESKVLIEAGVGLPEGDLNWT